MKGKCRGKPISQVRDIGEGLILQVVDFLLSVVECVQKSADLAVVLGELGLQFIAVSLSGEVQELGHEPQSQENRVRDGERDNGNEHGCVLSE